MVFLRSILLFFFAGICEIGGGYLIWHWLKGKFTLPMGLAGAALLVSTASCPLFRPRRISGACMPLTEAFSL